MSAVCFLPSSRLAPLQRHAAARACPTNAVPCPRRLYRRRTVQVAAAWGQLRGFGAAPEPEPEERFRSLFSATWIPPSNNPASVYDARDALEACSGLWGEERTECLGVFGLDAQQVDTFYSAVFSLEQALNQDTDPDEEAYHRGQERC